MKEALKYQIKALETLEYFEEEHPHVMAGEEIFDHILSQPGAMVPDGVGWDIENAKFDSVEEMFGGSSAIYLDIRWHKTKFLASDRIMPKEEFEKKHQ
jgi:hypothetical protein